MNNLETASNSAPENPSLPGVIALLRESWSIYRGRLGYFLMLSFVPGVLFGFLNSDFFSKKIFLSVPVGIGFGLIFFLIYVWTLLLLFLAVKHAGSENASRKALRDSLSLFPSFFWTQFLYFITVAGGYILLIIPGIVLSVRYLFAPIAVVDERIKGLSALSRSRDYTKGRWWAIFGRFVFISFLASIFYIFLFLVFKTLHVPQKLIFLSFFSIWLILPLSSIYLFQLFFRAKLTTSRSAEILPTKDRTPAIMGVIGVVTIVVLVFYFLNLKNRSTEFLEEVRSLQPRELSQCENPHPVLGRDGCFQHVAEYKLDPEICAMISDEDRLSNCFSNVAINRRDSSICERILKTNFWYDYCHKTATEGSARSNTEIKQNEDITSDWKTYRYDQYDFQISYPPDWTAYISASFEEGALGFNSPKDIQGNVMSFGVQRYDLQSDEYNYHPYPPQTLNAPNTNVDGLPAYEDEGYVRNPDGPSTQTIWVKKDSFVYSLTLQVFKKFNLPGQQYGDIQPAIFTPEEEKIRDGFISTFEFLQSN